MKKTCTCAAILLVFALLFTGCGGNTRSAERVYGESTLYSRQEIHSAMNVALQKFQLGFTGCTMTEIRYDEERTLREAERRAEKGEKGEVIVLVSTIEVSERHRGSFTPGMTYSGWSWELERSGLGGWKLTNYGFG